MTRTHQIYFVLRSDGMVKIGTTTDLKSRLATLQKSHGLLEVLRVINGDRRRERKLHRQFAKFHQFGEWFRDDAGALSAQIPRIPEGAALEVTDDEARAEWIAGETELMAKAKSMLHELVQARKFVSGQKRAEAQASVSADYGFSPWFLEHIRRGNATSVSAYGFQKLREAWVAEKTAQIEFLKSEMASLEANEAALRLKAQG